MKKLSEHTNSKKQGDAGLGDAIAYFTMNGYCVCVPLTDSQAYDLIIDDGKLQRVQVKTATYKKHNKHKAGDRRSATYYKIGLSTKGGNTRKNSVKKLDKTKVDLVYILTEEGNRYLIPVESLGGTSEITLSSKYDEFRVGMQIG